MRKRPIPYEQAVYGSFPFWSKGYAILARSANCRPEWIAALKSASQRYGERPRDCPDTGGAFAIPLPEGFAMIVGAFPGGSDDQGRPGAMVFHGLFVAPRPYRKIGFAPFGLLGELRAGWSIGDVDSILPSGTVSIGPDATTEAVSDPRVLEIARALDDRRRVLIPSDVPIETLARAVWKVLPDRTRRRISVATFAYDNGNGFDLVALPGVRATALALSRDPSCLIMEVGEPDNRPEKSSIPPKVHDSHSTRSRGVSSIMSRLTGPRFLKRMIRAIVPLLLAPLILGCGRGEEVTPQAIEKARATWKAAGIKDYDLELKIVSPAGHYVSTVRDGSVLKVESIQPDGRHVEVRPGDPRFYSIDGQFSNMAEELAQLKLESPFGQPKGTKVVMRFGPDPKLGYPQWYRRDVFGARLSAAIDVTRLDLAKPAP